MRSRTGFRPTLPRVLVGALALLAIFLIPPTPGASRSFTPSQTFTESWEDRSVKLVPQLQPWHSTPILAPTDGNGQVCTIAESDAQNRAMYQYIS